MGLGGGLPNATCDRLWEKLKSGELHDPLDDQFFTDSE